MKPTSSVLVRGKRAGLVAYVASIRFRDVLLLQGSPLLGMAFALDEITPGAIARGAIFTLASLLLVAHIFSLNDWAGIGSDARDPNKSADVFLTKGISRRGVGILSLALLVTSLLLFAALRPQTLLIAAAIAALGALYSHPLVNAKGMPVLSSLPHLAGGTLHFLLGYSLFASVDQRGILLALFFALTFTAGHLNQEVRDYEGDRSNHIRTNAVRFGKIPTFLAGFFVFTLAYADLFILARVGLVPAPLGWLTVLLYPVHVVLTVTTLRGGLHFESVSRLQARYRLLYAVIGVAMVMTLLFR